MSVKVVNSKQEFDKEISNGSTLVDFYATWCGPCKMLAPIIEKVSSIATDINFLKIDIDQLPTLANQYRIRSVPSVLLFKDGKVINQFIGFKPEHEVLEFINQNKK